MGLDATRNFSTAGTRDPTTGWNAIEEAIAQLDVRQAEAKEAYGEGNERRLTGTCETESIDQFSAGIGNRGASVRIPVQVHRGRLWVPGGQEASRELRPIPRDQYSRHLPLNSGPNMRVSAPGS